MRIKQMIVRVIPITTVILLMLVSKIGLAWALSPQEASNRGDKLVINYLNSRLEKLVKAAAPDKKGREYFILPESYELDSIPADTLNPLTPEKVKLGNLLFHETALSINSLNVKNWKTASCATCHIAEAGFRSNLARSLGTGGLGYNKSRHQDPDLAHTEIDKPNILAPSVLNSAYQEATLWNGRLGVTGSNGKEPLIKATDVNRLKLHGLEAQAIDAFTVHRLGTAAIAQIPEYQELFAQAFPDRPYVAAEVEDLKRAGLAIAAYERTLLANEAPFQKWLKGDKKAMSAKELRGGIVFFSFKANCLRCHRGPNLARDDFYAVGFADHPNDFSGLDLGRGAITRRARDDFKFKVPQLYNLADSTPYGHGASFGTLGEVVDYFNRGKPENLAAKYSGNISRFFQPLNLTEKEVDDLTAFLETGLRDPNLSRYVPKRLPSGLCFPNNDPESRQQLACD
ncbi:MAG: cytochrome-c peroxidase [Hormoscilla sp.]